MTRDADCWCCELATTTISSPAALSVIEPAFTEAEKLALAGFLAGYCCGARVVATDP